MKTVLLTGSSSGIGRACALRFLEEGYYVIGVSRTASGICHDNFEEHLFDLKDTHMAIDFARSIKAGHSIDILVNNAGLGYYGPFSDISPDKINEMVTVNFTIPMILSNLFLPSLKKTKGVIINISSVTAKNNNNTHGVVYGATKAGLTSFSSSLFAEIRKTGIRVVTIHPEMTDTKLYRNADFCADSGEGCSLNTNDVCNAIFYALKADACNISDITLTPQLNRIARKKS